MVSFHPTDWLTLGGASVGPLSCGFPVPLSVSSTVVVVGALDRPAVPSALVVCVWGWCSSGSLIRGVHLVLACLCLSVGCLLFSWCSLLPLRVQFAVCSLAFLVEVALGPCLGVGLLDSRHFWLVVAVAFCCVLAEHCGMPCWDNWFSGWPGQHVPACSCVVHFPVAHHLWCLYFT